MSFRFSARRSLLAGAGAVALLAACDADRASVLDPFGNSARTFQVNAVAAANSSIPAGTARVTRPATGVSSLTVTLRHLEPLTGGVYKVWIGDEATNAVTNWTPATGTLMVITGPSTDRDTVVTNAVSSFNGVADTTARYVLTLDAAQLGSDPSATARNVVLVSIESSDAATAPGATSPKPLWARITQPAASASATANFSFGNYDPDPTKQYVFPVAGKGTATVRDNFLAVDDTMLGRPPRGYYYVAYLFGEDAEGTPTDTIVLGDLAAPWPRNGVSLKDADMSLVDAVVLDRPYAISAASVRYTGPATMLFAGYPRVVIALKNKLGAAGVAPPNTILAGDLPDEIAFPEEAP